MRLLEQFILPRRRDEEQREGQAENAGGAVTQQRSRSVKGNGRRGGGHGKRGGLEAVIVSRVTSFSEATHHKKLLFPLIQQMILFSMRVASRKRGAGREDGLVMQKAQFAVGS